MVEFSSLCSGLSFLMPLLLSSSLYEQKIIEACQCGNERVGNKVRKWEMGVRFSKSSVDWCSLGYCEVSFTQSHRLAVILRLLHFNC